MGLSQDAVLRAGRRRDRPAGRASPTGSTRRRRCRPAAAGRSPTCCEHAGTVYRWAATMVRDSSPERLRPRARSTGTCPTIPADLPGLVRRRRAASRVEQFRACDPATPMWAWGWPKAAGFWPRRMVHEIGVHRADAELALGLERRLRPRGRRRRRRRAARQPPPRRLLRPRRRRAPGRRRGARRCEAPDAGASWRITLLPDRFDVGARRRGPADATSVAGAGPRPAARALRAPGLRRARRRRRPLRPLDRQLGDLSGATAGLPAAVETGARCCGSRTGAPTRLSTGSWRPPGTTLGVAARRGRSPTSTGSGGRSPPTSACGGARRPTAASPWPTTPCRAPCGSPGRG